MKLYFPKLFSRFRFHFFCSFRFSEVIEGVNIFPYVSELQEKMQDIWIDISLYFIFGTTYVH
jgi:hypothetical protein